jgi:hypothetical protein
MVAISFYSNVFKAHGKYFVCCGVLQVKGVTTPTHENPFPTSYLLFV